MRYPSSVVLSILFMGCLFIGCNDQEITASAPGESIPSLEKVTIIEDYFDVTATGPGQYMDCTGAIMKWHGTIRANYRILLTPSGQYIETGHVDYNAYGGITLENMSTQEVWTLQTGTNPWSWIEHHDGSLRFHYQWNELYRLDNQTLHVHVQGFFTLDRNGNVTRALENSWCN